MHFCLFLIDHLIKIMFCAKTCDWNNFFHYSQSWVLLSQNEKPEWKGLMCPMAPCWLPPSVSRARGGPAKISFLNVQCKKLEIQYTTKGELVTLNPSIFTASQRITECYFLCFFNCLGWRKLWRTQFHGIKEQLAQVGDVQVKPDTVSPSPSCEPFCSRWGPKDWDFLLLNKILINVVNSYHTYKYFFRCI